MYEQKIVTENERRMIVCHAVWRRAGVFCPTVFLDPEVSTWYHYGQRSYVSETFGRSLLMKALSVRYTLRMKRFGVMSRNRRDIPNTRNPRDLPNTRNPRDIPNTRNRRDIAEIYQTPGIAEIYQIPGIYCFFG